MMFHLICHLALWITFIYVTLPKRLKVEAVKLVYDEIMPVRNEQNLPPIILLHGIITWRKDWKYVAPEIANNTGRKVYSIDAQNHGESPWTEEFSFIAMAEDLDEFLVDHGITKAILLGHSMGGKTAIVYALRKPEKVEKLIVEDIIVKNISTQLIKRFLGMAQAAETALHEIVPGNNEEEDKQNVYRLFRPVFRMYLQKDITDFELFPVKREGDRLTLVANIEMLRSMNFFEKANLRLSGVFMGNTLFLYGTKSFFDVGEDETITQFFPRAKLVAFDGGHMIHHQFPEKFVKVVSDFINSEENS